MKILKCDEKNFLKDLYEFFLLKWQFWWTNFVNKMVLRETVMGNYLL